MELVSPGLGLIFWTCLIFLVLFLLLRKFAFPVITKMLKEREEGIRTALDQAELARQEMQALTDENVRIMEDARAERAQMLTEAQELKMQVLEDSKQKAKEEYDRIVGAAMEDIEVFRKRAVEDIRVQISEISLEIAEKIIKQKFEDEEFQKAFVEKELDEISEHLKK